MKLKRIVNLLRYGWGEEGKKQKQLDKQKRRQEKFQSERWEKGGDVVRRRYASYDDYLQHQRAKLDTIVHRLQESEKEDYEEFRRRFATCDALQGKRSVLCLGARLGTEVKALHSLGYFAVGIDLNPGENNSYVLPGDFHSLVFPDGSVDAVYCNAFDHAYDPERNITEVRRVLDRGGVFILDQLEGFREGFIPGEYESFHWRDRNVLNDKICEWGGFEMVSERDLGRHRRDRWYQVVFRKRPTPANQ